MHCITEPAQFEQYSTACDVLLVDALFTDDRLAAFLKAVKARQDLPIVVAIPEDHPEWALDALDAGATAYVVKTKGYAALVNRAVKDAKCRFDERALLHKTLAAMRTMSDGRRPASPAESQARAPARGGAAAPKAGQPEKRTTLIEEIARQFRAGEISIPAYPDINLKVQRLIKEQADLAEIADLIRNDAAICSKLISLSNSARYGCGREIKTVEQALNLLGMKETQRYVDVIAQQSLYRVKHRDFEPVMQRLWLHSMACAHAAEIVSRHTLLGAPDEVFIMGLLHDIGVLLLVQVIADLHSQGATEPMSMPELQQFLLLHHGRFGKSVLDRWKFPETYGCIALNHDDVQMKQGALPELLVVHFANELVKNAGYAIFPAEPIDLSASSSARLLRLRADEIDAIQQELKPLVEESRLTLG